MNKFFQFNEYVELGKLFRDCKAYLIALEHFDKALELSYLPVSKYRLLELFELRGNINAHLLRYDKAIIDYSKAIAIEPENIDLIMNRAIAYEFLYKDQLALRDYEYAYYLDPNFELAKYMVDYLYKKLKN